MKVLLVRLVAALMVSGQLLPAALPILCEQSTQAMPTNCEQQMPSRSSGPAVDVATHVTPCGNPAFCASMVTAVVALSPAVSGSVGESRLVAFAVMTFVPVDPQAPLPPPPQA